MQSNNYLYPSAPRTTRSLSPQPYRMDTLMSPSARSPEESPRCSLLLANARLERSNSIIPTRLTIALCPNMTTSQVNSIKKSWKHINTKGLFNVIRRCYQRCQCCCPSVASAFTNESLKKQNMMPICGISEHTKYFILLFDRIIDNEPNIEDTLRKIGRVHVKLYEEYKLTIADIERLGEIVADVFLKLDGIRQNKETSKSWRILIASIFDEVRVGYESELRLCRRKSSNFPDFSNPSSSRNSNPSILEGLPSTSGSNMGPSSSKIGDICQKISEL